MKKIVAVLGFLLLTAAKGASYQPRIPAPVTKAVDGYTFNNPTLDRSKVEVTLVYFKTIGDLRRTYTKMTGERAGTDLQAFTAISKDEAKCTIYIMHPSVSYRPEMFGHELTHCAFGEFH